MKKKKLAFILDLFLFLASFFSFIYAVFIHGAGMNITSWIFLIVAIGSLVRINQEIKAGFK